MKWLLGVLGTIGLSLVAAECSAVAPWLAERLLRGATQVLPPGQHRRYLLEWLAELDAVPGQLVKLLFAIRFALRAPATRRELQGVDPLWVVLVRRLLAALVTAALAIARHLSRVLVRMPTKRRAANDRVLLLGDPDQLPPRFKQRMLTTPLVSPEWRLAFHCRLLTAATSSPIDRSTTAERALDGLIASDKFCWTRHGQLRLDWWRRPLRRRPLGGCSPSE